MTLQQFYYYERLLMCEHAGAVRVQFCGSHYNLS